MFLVQYFAKTGCRFGFDRRVSMRTFVICSAFLIMGNNMNWIGLKVGEGGQEPIRDGSGAKTGFRFKFGISS